MKHWVTGWPLSPSRWRCRRGSSRSSRTPACCRRSSRPGLSLRVYLVLAPVLWSRGCGAQGFPAPELGEELRTLKRADFWDPKPGLGLLGGRLFREKLDQLLPVETFSECRAPVAISVYDLSKRKTQVLVEGDLASAILASCALPVLFHPVRREGCLLSDGGIADRPGLDGMAHHQRTLYHHIASRSPWRRAGSTSLKIPSRTAMVSLRIADLPRANPFHLERGVAAMQAAREATARALSSPLSTLWFRWPARRRRRSGAEQSLRPRCDRSGGRWRQRSWRCLPPASCALWLRQRRTSLESRWPPA